MSIERVLQQMADGNPEVDPLMDTGLDDEVDEGLTIIEIPDDGDEAAILAEFDEQAAMNDEPVAHSENLAEYMNDEERHRLAEDLCELVKGDIESRKEWVRMYVKGLEVLGLQYEEKTEPWDGACGVTSNLLIEAAVRFQAETMGETFPASGPVKTLIIGEETKEKEEAAERVRVDMNHELTENMVEYRAEHERLLYQLGLSGAGFKKVYRDETVGRQMAVYVSAEEVIVPYGETHINLAERVTHILRQTSQQVQTLQTMGFYRSCDLGDPVPFRTDIDDKKAEEEGFEVNDDNRHAFYEVHTDLILSEYLDEETATRLGMPPREEETKDAEGNVLPRQKLPSPYIVTIDQNTQEVLAVRRNWAEGDMEETKRQHFVHYSYIHGMGFYGIGLVHLIGGYAIAGTLLIRQLIDAGTLANLQGGFKTKGLRVEGDDTPIGPGEWRDVDVSGGSIRENLLPLPYKEPSPALITLLDKITQQGRELGSTSDVAISDMSANAPVGTTLALLERTLKPMTAVQARVHYAMKQEFKLLKDLIAEDAATYEYDPTKGERTAKAEDYALVEVIPVSDPNNSTMAQRVVQYQTALQMSKDAPQIYDLTQLHRQMLETIGIKNAEKIIPTEDDAIPRDPVSEHIAVLKGDPLKAFIYQDHEAHIKAHMAFMQDPSVMGIIGQSPQAKTIIPALQAHIAEHVGYKYRTDIEEKLGVQLPPPDSEMGEEFEINLSRVIADAAQQQKQANIQEAQQRQAMQQAKDPVVQKEKEERALKKAEIDRKAKKDAMDKDSKDRQAAMQHEINMLRHKLDEKEFLHESEIDRAELRIKELETQMRQVFGG